MSRFWTPLPHFRGGRAFLDRNLQSAIAVLCILLLASCGESSPHGYAGSASSDTLKPVVAPPGSDVSPALPGTTGVPKTADGLPVLGAKGVNTALFANKLDDPDARLDRLENSVQELRNDFDAMSPAILRLISIEGDIQNLIGQLDVLTGKTPPDSSVPPMDASALDAAPVQPESVPLPPKPGDAQAAMDPERDSVTEPTSDLATAMPPAPAQETAAPAVSGTPAPETAPAPPTAIVPPVVAQATPAPTTTPAPAAKAEPASKTASSDTAVQAIRLGEHPGKVRIVLDIHGKTTFTADLDNQEKLLVVELPKAAWNAAAQQSFSGNPVIASYKTEAMSDGGTRLIIKLKKGTSIAYKSAMDDAANGGSKVIIDLTSK